jgi:hypothetical protein
VRAACLCHDEHAGGCIRIGYQHSNAYLCHDEHAGRHRRLFRGADDDRTAQRRRRHVLLDLDVAAGVRAHELQRDPLRTAVRFGSRCDSGPGVIAAASSQSTVRGESRRVGE